MNRNPAHIHRYRENFIKKEAASNTPIKKKGITISSTAIDIIRASLPRIEWVLLFLGYSWFPVAAPFIQVDGRKY